MAKQLKNQKLRPLFDRLVQYGLEDNITPFDVPGHKMGKGIHKDFIEVVGETIFKLDINSSKEVDMLSNPQGVIKEAEELAADAFKSDHAYFIVNGSTSGVQNMILASLSPNEKIIMPRNVHKSAINGLILSGAIPVFMNPYIDHHLGISMGVPFDEAKKVIDENLDAKAILLINPTYFGIVSDLERITTYAKSKNMLVLIDESHGAHFPFHQDFPKFSMSYGADLSTVSMHKTGGSLTQSSLLLMNEGHIDKQELRNTINLMQSSSASYLLMASLDIARYNLVENGNDIFEKAFLLADFARTKINEIEGLHCFGKEIINGDSIYDMDLTKLIIDVSGLGTTGFDVYDRLKQEFGIQVELAEEHVILAIISMGDELSDLLVLIDALKEISKNRQVLEKDIFNFEVKPSAIYVSPRDAYYSKKEHVLLDDCVGRISGGSLMIYPPGIPLVIPGEKITHEIIDYFKYLYHKKIITIGAENDNGEIKLLVLKEN